MSVFTNDVSVSNTVTVDGSAVTQPVSGTVTANAGSGTFSVDGSAHTQPVSGSISVSNFPVTQPVSGTVTATQATGTNLHVVVDSGTVTTTSGTSNTATITRVATSTTAVTALASNAARKKAILATETGTTYVALGSTASATNYTYPLSSNSVLEINGWTGSISVVRSAGSGNIQVTELV